jgi:hypothetical protein
MSLLSGSPVLLQEASETMTGSNLAEKRPAQVVHWRSSTQVLSTLAREGFGACCRGESRGSNPYAIGVRDRNRPELAQQEWEMAEEWRHGWDEAHIGR